MKLRLVLLLSFLCFLPGLCHAQQGGGVQSINGVPGPFTFGSGSTCVGTTCTFSGGGGGGLPTATAANQVPAASGAGTTYTAQTVPNAFWASASTPLYTFCHIRDDSSRLWISYSVDGTHWIDTTASSQLLPSQLLRDPSCMYQASTNTFYFVATNGATTFLYFTWTNGVFSSIQNITVTGATTGTEAPEWFTDPVSGNIYALVAYQTAASGANHVIGISQFTLGSQTFGTFTQLTLSGSASSIDPFMVYTAANSTYNLFYANLAVANEQLNVATSTSLTGTFTQQNGTNPLFAFLAGVTLNEGPAVFTLPNGCYRMVFDSSLGASPSNYFETQADNCNTSLLYSTWTTPVYVDIDRAEHGTVIPVTTNAGAQQIFALAQQKPDYANAGRWLFGGNATDTPWWPLFVKTLSNAGGLSSNQPAGIWMDSLASDVPPYTHAAGIYQDLSVAGQLDTSGNFNAASLSTPLSLIALGLQPSTFSSAAEFIYGGTYGGIVAFGADSTHYAGALLSGREGASSSNFINYLFCPGGTSATGTCTFAWNVTAPSFTTTGSRKGTFVCTAAGTITIANANELVTSDVIISLNTAGGTISTSPAMKTVTSGTGFTVLCGASDTSTYNYDILN